MKVYIMPESQVYHLSSKCAGLRRHGTYAHPVSAERLEDGAMFYTGGFHANQRVRGSRRPCGICARATALEEERA